MLKKKKKKGIVLQLFFLFFWFVFLKPTSAVLEREVGEPPNVPQTHRVSNHGQDEIQFIGPVSSGLILIAFLVIVVILRK